MYDYYNKYGANPIVARIFPQRHGKGPSHRKDSNLSAEKRKGRSKQKERKAHHIVRCVDAGGDGGVGLWWWWRYDDDERLVAIVVTMVLVEGGDGSSGDEDGVGW
ncbi:hypothetical protein Tco_0852500 [Tanacetum coccineum]